MAFPQDAVVALEIVVLNNGAFFLFHIGAGFCRRCILLRCGRAVCGLCVCNEAGSIVYTFGSIAKNRLASRAVKNAMKKEKGK